MVYSELVVTLPPVDESTLLSTKLDDNSIMYDKLIIAQPQLQYGFNYLTHIIKNKLDEQSYQQKLKENPKHKYIINPFEHNIELKHNDFQDILHSTINKFNLKDKKISSRSFFKMWEMLNRHKLESDEKSNPLIKDNDSEFSSFHMAEAPGGFIQATILYNEQFNKHFNKTKYYGISLENEIKFSPMLQKYYGSGKNRQFFQFKVSKDLDGDITKISNMNTLLKTFIKNKQSFITADGGFDPFNEQYHEQESYILFFAEVVLALGIQKKGGSFVCKFLDVHTSVSVKILYIISLFYNDVKMTKPHTSRQSNSERYIIASDFKYSTSDAKYKEQFENVYKVYKKCKELDSQHINILDIYPDFEVPHLYRVIVSQYNTKITDQQFENINMRLDYYKQLGINNDLFKKYSKVQEEATQWWIETYLN